MNLLMNRPFDLVKEELAYMNYLSFESMSAANNEFLIKRAGRITTVNTCNCQIFHSYVLVCRHILCVRNLIKVELFDKTLYQKDGPRNIAEHLIEFLYKVMNTNQSQLKQ